MSEDASSEDGEVSKRDIDSRDHGASEDVDVQHLAMARITRDMLEKACHRKDFEDFVVGKQRLPPVFERFCQLN